MFEETPSPDILSQSPEVLDPLHLGLSDNKIIVTVRENIRSWKAFYSERDLFARQERLKQYYLGRQELFKASNKSKPYKENIIYEGISRQKPIELSRMPDLTVKPGDDSKEAKDSAEKLSGIFNSDIRKRKNRKMLGLAAKQEPIYLYAPIKARWNPEQGPYGDYEFVNVHPNNIIWDHNCATNDADDMRFVTEKAKYTAKEVMMMFPDKIEEIKKEFGWEENDSGEDKKLATPIEIFETWFHWYKLDESGTSRKIDGVVWTYGQTVLKKMKNPYYDFIGTDKSFSLVMEEKNAYTVEEVYNKLFGGAEDSQDISYSNYFEEPRKPYFFMVYDNFGEHPIGETSRVEQMLEFQDAVNMDGSVIQDMNVRSRGKDLFDTNAIPQTTLDTTDLYNIDQALGLDVPQGSSINNVHSRIEQKPATPQQYRSMEENRSKGFEMLGVGPSSRGLADPQVTLGQQQMSREGDYGLIDDIVEDTINAAAEWQAQWSMQFIKLFYTKPHMRHILGKDGEVLHSRLTQDMVDNGMEVVVSASGVDKLQRKRVAMENAKLGMSDPLSFFEDTEQSNPKERAKRAMLFKMAPQMYMQEYVVDALSPDNPMMPGQPDQMMQPPMQQPMGGGNPDDPLGLFI